MEIYEGKRQHQEISSKSSRSPSPETPGAVSPVSDLNGDSFRPLLRTPPPSRVGPPPSPPVPTHPVAPVAPEPAAPLPLMPCQVCGRTFVPQSLAKHVKICEKMTIKKRKTFDSSRQRREGTDLEQYLPKNFGLPENSPFLEKSPPPAAKPTPKPKPQSVRGAITKVSKPTSELQRCPHCNRAFGVRAFERHVEWCADKAKILPAAPAQAPQHIADAKQRLNARTQYKAPLVRTRRSSQTRDKSSNSRSASVDSSRGVSPPPRPREYGDYKNGRSRASESASSNDCQEESSHHVPVIRNSRHTQNSSSGDANVKARQARLARDLSNSRKKQDPSLSLVQESSTDPSIKKNVNQNKPKHRLNSKKLQHLKKLEQIASKYSAHTQDKIEDKKEVRTIRDSNNSSIPLPKKGTFKRRDTALARDIQMKKEKLDHNDSSDGSHIKSKTAFRESSVISIKNNINDKGKKGQNRKQPTNIVKQNSMSIDSLDECSSNSTRSRINRNCQSVGINTELLCVPCVIHDNPDQKKENNTHIKGIMKNNNNPARLKTDTDPNTHISELKVELLYKNPALNVCKDSTENHDEDNFACTHTSSENFTSGPVLSNKGSNNLAISETKLSSVHTEIDLDGTHKLNNTISNSEEIIEHIHISPKENFAENVEQINEDIYNLSAEERSEENYDHDISNDSIEVTYNDKNLIIEGSEIECRHGSGETYTKFTEDPADLQEFMNLTDKLLTNDQRGQQYSNVDQDIDDFHTPNTSSLESINNRDLNTTEPLKHHFSDEFEELKNNFKELLQNSRNISEIDTSVVGNKDTTITNKQVTDMEHITVYKVNFFKEKCEESISTETFRPELKLPSIIETKTPGRRVECSKKKIQNIYKSNRKFKMLGDQNRNNKDNKTFIVQQSNDNNSDSQSISDAPPLKLPRLEKKRLDDNYDPFVCAARQMKELMSSETNIPKKIQSPPKDHSRTLPALQPTKEKGSLSYLRSDNTKMLKDSLNKTYQKTPTLQRMKSFGSTNNDNSSNSFGGRCSSFRLNRNDKKPSPKLNTTFTKASKENISNVDKNYFNRNSNLNRSFSSYTTSNYSTPKVKEKVPKIATSMYHSFQRTTVKQSMKLDKIQRDDKKKEFVNLDSILACDHSSMTDSNYIDPMLINENDNLPINVNTILNNPDIISSMESLLTTENLPAKFESFSTVNQNNNNTSNNTHININNKTDKSEQNNNVNKTTALIVDDLSRHYDKIMHSLEQSIASKTSIRDDDSLCEDFDLEEFMTSFDEEIDRHKLQNKRTCSSTTRVVKQSELLDSNRTSEINSISSSPKVMHSMNSVNKSMSLNFSNNIINESLFPSSMKRSTSLLDSIQKKNALKMESGKSHQKSDQLEQDIMQSLKDFDKIYETDKNGTLSNKETSNQNGTARKVKSEKKIKKSPDNLTNGNYTPNGKTSNDSAYSSLNRISPSKLSICTSKEQNGLISLEQIPAGSDSSGSHKDDVRSVSSEEFLAMERSAEMDEPIKSPEPPYKEQENHNDEKCVSSRASSRRSTTWRTGGGTLSSSGSEASLHHVRRDSAPVPRLSRFCHECGNKFPVDTAKFCIECGVKRLVV